MGSAATGVRVPAGGQKVKMGTSRTLAAADEGALSRHVFARVVFSTLPPGLAPRRHPVRAVGPALLSRCHGSGRAWRPGLMICTMIQPACSNGGFARTEEKMLVLSDSWH